MRFAIIAAFLIASPALAQTPPAKEGPVEWNIEPYRDDARIDKPLAPPKTAAAARSEMLRQAKGVMTAEQLAAWSKATSLSVNSSARYMEWFLRADSQTYVRVTYHNTARDLPAVK